MRSRSIQLAARLVSASALVLALGGCAGLPATPAVHCSRSDACESIEAPALSGAPLEVYGATSYVRSKGKKRGPQIWLDLRANGAVAISEVDALRRGVVLEVELSRRPSFAAVTTATLADAGYGELGLHYWLGPSASSDAAIETVTLANESGRASDWERREVASTPLPDAAQLLPCSRGVIVIAKDSQRASLLGFDGRELGFDGPASAIDPAWLARSAGLWALPSCAGFLSATDGLAWEVWDAARGLQQLTAGKPEDRWVGIGTDELARVSVHGRAHEVEFWTPPKDAGGRWRRGEVRSIDVAENESIVDLAGLSTGEVVLVRAGDKRAALVVVARDGSTRARPMVATAGETLDVAAGSGSGSGVFEVHGGRLD